MFPISSAVLRSSKSLNPPNPVTSAIMDWGGKLVISIRKELPFTPAINIKLGSLRPLRDNLSSSDKLPSKSRNSSISELEVSLSRTNTSLPFPPVRISLLFPPVRVSLPFPPVRVSLPDPPSRELLPLSNNSERRSSPDPPKRVSLPR